MTTLIVLNTFIFFVLSALHVYWGLGGRWAWSSVLPTTPEGNLLFKPSAKASFVVAFGILLCAVITIGNLGLLDHWIERAYIQYGTWTIAVIFLLRAVGDFRFVGFTKRIYHTKFAANDTKLYSPLCLIIAFFSFLIAL